MIEIRATSDTASHTVDFELDRYGVRAIFTCNMAPGAGSCRTEDSPHGCEFIEWVTVDGEYWAFESFVGKERIEDHSNAVEFHWTGGEYEWRFAKGEPEAGWLR